MRTKRQVRARWPGRTDIRDLEAGSGLPSEPLTPLPGIGGPIPLAAAFQGWELVHFASKAKRYAVLDNEGRLALYEAGRLRMRGEPLDATLAATGIPLFALDLRQAPKSGPVAEWLRVAHKSRNVGPTYVDDRPDRYMADLIAPECFDAILFVEKSTAPHKRLRRR